MPVCERQTRQSGHGRTPLRIEGSSVDHILQEVYDAVIDSASERGLSVRFDVIAWELLSVAADRDELIDCLCAVTDHVLSQTAYGGVTIRAMPSHDDIYVQFEVENGHPARRWDDQVATAHDLETVRERIQKMRGEMAEFSTERGGARCCFWLPQWI